MTTQVKQSIRQALEACNLVWIEHHPSAWELTGPLPRPIFLVAQDDTVRLQAEAGPLQDLLPETNGHPPELALLSHAATLSGTVKYGLHGHQQIRCSTEFFPADLIPAAAELPEALTGMTQAIHFCMGQMAFKEQGATVSTQPMYAEDLGGLREIAPLTGWPFHERDHGDLAFDLDENRVLRQAVLSVAEGRCIRLAVSLDPVPASEETSLRAMAGFMLRANPLLGTTRAVLHKEEDAWVPVLERVWSRLPGSEALLFGLEHLNDASLSVGCELQALADAELALAYLGLGPACLPSSLPTQPQPKELTP